MSSPAHRLVAACQGGDVTYVKHLLAREKDVDVNECDSRGQLPLCAAIQAKSWRVIDLLLKSKCDVDMARCKDKQTPLQLAVVHGTEGIVKRLLQAGCSIDKRSGLNHATAMQMAIIKRKPKMVKLLLASGSVLANSLESVSGVSVLFQAIFAKDEAIMRMLVNAKSDVNEVAESGYGREYMTPLMLACNEHSEAAVRVLLKAKCHTELTTSNHRKTAMMFACEAGGTSIVSMLLKAGTRVDAEDVHGMTALHYAAQKNSRRMVQLLLKAGSDINFQSRATLQGSALWVATRNGCVESAHELLEQGADVNVVTPQVAPVLYVAANSGDVRVMKILLEGKADVNILFRGLLTPLHVAAFRGKVGAVQMLLKAGCEVNVKTESGRGLSALYCAAAGSLTNYLHTTKETQGGIIRDLLVLGGANVNVLTDEGVSVLHMALKRRLPTAIIERLLLSGARVNDKTCGVTPLQVALEVRVEPRVVEMLLDAGADADEMVPYLGNALNVAMLRAQCPASVKLLLERGASTTRLASDGRNALQLLYKNYCTVDIAKTIVMTVLKHMENAMAECFETRSKTLKILNITCTEEVGCMASALELAIVARDFEGAKKMIAMGCRFPEVLMKAEEEGEVAVLGAMLDKREEMERLALVFYSGLLRSSSKVRMLPKDVVKTVCQTVMADFKIPSLDVRPPVQQNGDDSDEMEEVEDSEDENEDEVQTQQYGVGVAPGNGGAEAEEDDLSEDDASSNSVELSTIQLPPLHAFRQYIWDTMYLFEEHKVPGALAHPE